MALGAASLAPVAWLCLQGELERYGPVVIRSSTPVPPAWAAPCRRRSAEGVVFVRRCARVDGLVIWREQDDPDGDGDRHLLVVADRRPVKLKFPRGVGPRELPGLGKRARVTGDLPEEEGVVEVRVRRATPP